MTGPEGRPAKVSVEALCSPSLCRHPPAGDLGRWGREKRAGPGCQELQPQGPGCEPQPFFRTRLLCNSHRGGSVGRGVSAQVTMTSTADLGLKQQDMYHLIVWRLGVRGPGVAGLSLPRPPGHVDSRPLPVPPRARPVCVCVLVSPRKDPVRLD